MFFALLSGIAVSVPFWNACTVDRSGDPLDTMNRAKGQKISEVSDPTVTTRPGAGATVSLTNVQVVAVDTFDETGNGRSRGTIYVKDYGSSEPYSGIGLFSPVFIPGDLRVAPGDVLDMDGLYQENVNIGTARFPEGQVLPQLSRPTAHFRFESPVPAPVKINAADLATYDAGRRWIGSLVTVEGTSVTKAFTADNAGRVNGSITGSDGTSVIVVSNELTDLTADAYSVGAMLSSVTGVVTYFNTTSAPAGTTGLRLAPRAGTDVVAQ